jgi:hypothetical protein
MEFIGLLKCFFCINMWFAGIKVVTSAQILLGNDIDVMFVGHYVCGGRVCCGVGMLPVS